MTGHLGPLVVTVSLCELERCITVLDRCPGQSTDSIYVPLACLGLMTLWVNFRMRCQGAQQGGTWSEEIQ